MTGSRLAALGTPLVSGLKFEFLFQWRQGFVLAYGIVTAAYVAVALLLPPALVRYILPVLLYTDPSIMGFLFVGGGLMLERDQGTIEGIRITPRSLDLFILRKGTAFSLAATAMVTIICFAALGRAPWEVLVGTFLGCFFYTAIGIVVASGSAGINDFIMRGSAAMTFMVVPMARVFFPDIPALAMVYPGFGVFRLVMASVEHLPATEIALALATTVLFIVPAFRWAAKSLDASIVRSMGSDT